MALFGKKNKEPEFKKAKEPVIDPQEVQEPVQQPVQQPQQQGYYQQPSMPQPPAPVEKKSSWEVREVATQSEPVIFNSKDQKPYTILQAIVEILNRTEE